MITRAEISGFCKKNKIKEPWFNPNDKKDTYAIISMSDIDYFRKFYKRRPSDLWINLDTDDNKKVIDSIRTMKLSFDSYVSNYIEMLVPSSLMKR